MGPFHPNFEDLPTSLALFPLPGILLLPDQILPLNVFEDRYIRMFEDIMGQGRLVGILQPRDPSDKELETQAIESETALFDMGCMGRVTSFEETSDGRFSVQIRGVCRFTLNDAKLLERGYREGAISWDGFQDDLHENEIVDLDTAKLFDLLRLFFKKNEMSMDMKMIETAPINRMINALSMICPFGAMERQALLEVQTLQGRGQMLITLLEMAILDGGGDVGFASS